MVVPELDLVIAVTSNPAPSADFDSLQSVILPGCSLGQKGEATEDGAQVRGIARRCRNIHHIRE